MEHIGTSMVLAVHLMEHVLEQMEHFMEQYTKGHKL